MRKIKKTIPFSLTAAAAASIAALACFAAPASAAGAAQADLVGNNTSAYVAAGSAQIAHFSFTNYGASAIDAGASLNFGLHAGAGSSFTTDTTKIVFHSSNGNSASLANLFNGTGPCQVTPSTISCSTAVAWNLGSALGASQTFSIDVPVSIATNASGMILETATATPGSYDLIGPEFVDPNIGNNAASQAFLVSAPAPAPVPVPVPSPTCLDRLTGPLKGFVQACTVDAKGIHLRVSTNWVNTVARLVLFKNGQYDGETYLNTAYNATATRIDVNTYQFDYTRDGTFAAGDVLSIQGFTNTPGGALNGGTELLHATF